MERIKYDMSLIKTMSLFEEVTRTQLKDCFIDRNSHLLFIVDEANMSKAIGKRGQNVKHLEKLLNRKIKIVSFTPDVLQFIQNLILPFKVRDIKAQENIVTITGQDTHSKALIIGKNAQNLRNFESMVQRYFPEIKEIKVI
ncbi:MAG: NusA-like transcription termination signal-binding factor [Candidatus Woesearchaeota archaeon]